MMPAVVCNTGPVIALASIDRLELLKSLFREVLIPEAVHKEILLGGVSSAGLSAYRNNAVQEMREGGYWIHDDIVQFVLREAGEG